MASIQEIAAMKMDLIARGGRKKDFWDIHALLDIFNLSEMLGFYIKGFRMDVPKMRLPLV